VLGFHAAKSHRIVDMRENHILRPELLALVDSLRKLLAGMLARGRAGEVQMTLVDQGVDLLLKGVAPEGLPQVEALTAFCESHRLARLSLDQGYGPEAFYEPDPATVTLSGTPVPFPPGGFLQATVEGERALVAAVTEALEGAARTADLFAGLGTFALALKGQVYAAEAAREAVLSLKRAAPHVGVEHRDLYRRPLDGAELARLDAIVVDPPRSGAEAQVRNIAGSAVERIAYVSCNPATFARDAAILIDGGYRLEWVRPVGQFRWSTHVELAALFVR
jgi:23S rRNA (uracil1939-C5)-methyltransferase